jgi:hypothetical protein
MKEYYTYAYLREDGTPYYIGKGKENRINDYHTKFVKLPPPNRRIILKTFDNEKDAFTHEIYMIAILGRKEFGGLLINRTPGGDNPPICEGVSEETRKKISESHKGMKKPWTWNKGIITSHSERATYMREYRKAKKEGTWKDGRRNLK